MSIRSHRPRQPFVLLPAFALLLAACSAQSGSPGASAGASASASASEAANPSCTASATAPADMTGSLTVLDWAGYDAKDFWTDFGTNYPKVNVGFEIGESDADIFSKMSTGDQADIFHPYTGWLQFYVDNHLVEPIDTSRLTNWDKVPDSFKKIGQVNGKQYFIPWDWGFSSILYRTDKVPSVDSWSVLFDPKYAKHVSMWDDGPAAVTTSSYIHGWDETKITDAQLATIKQEWTDQQANINLTNWAGEPELTAAMASGDVWAAYAWQGAYATLLGQGVPVAYANPKEGRNSWVGVYGIRKGTTNCDLAYRFLDQKLADKTSQNVVDLFYYGSANQTVMNGITDPTLKQAFSLDDPNILSHTNFTPNVTAAQRDAWTAMWAEVKAGK